MPGTIASPPASHAAEADRWIVRLASGAMTAAELVTFEAWLDSAMENRAAFDRARALWQMLDRGAGAVIELPRPAAASQVRGRPRAGWRWAVSVAMAASVGALIMVPDAVMRLRATDMTATGEIRRLTLPDGSQAVLDTDTAIAVRYDRGQREIALLKGRGWFDVRHDDTRPFRVVSTGGTTRDVGTAFEVTRDDGSTGVAVTEGAVSVHPEGSDSAVGMLLHERQRVRYTADGRMRRLADVDADDIAAWRRGYVIIDDRPLAEAVAAVSRYRSGMTWVPSTRDGRTRVSGVFRTDAPDAALNVLAQTAGLRVVRAPGIAVLMK